MNKIEEKINHIRCETEMEESILFLLKLDDFSPVFNYADKVNTLHHGLFVDIRAILEFSNICKRKCKYCGLNSQNKNVHRYRMNREEIISTALEAIKAGYRTLVMQSGEDDFFTAEYLGEIVKEIKSLSNVAITLSCGERTYEELKHLKKCGADRYLLKHETADTSLYSFLHSCGTLENRVQCLRNIYELGYETGSGFMIGLPNQTLQTVTKDLLLLRDLKCHMAGIGPFIPHPDTVLSAYPAGSTELTKRAVAIARILLPKANLPATTSLGVLDSNEKNNIFSCGANIIMRKVTPPNYVRHYEIYPGAKGVSDIYAERKELEDSIKALGKIPR